MQAKIIQIGNSYGLRLPKQFIEKQKLSLGDTVSINPKKASYKADTVASIIREAQAAVAKKSVGEGSSIEEIVEWQRQQRVSDNPWLTVPDADSFSDKQLGRKPRKKA